MLEACPEAVIAMAEVAEGLFKLGDPRKRPVALACGRGGWRSPLTSTPAIVASPATMEASHSNVVRDEHGRRVDALGE